MSDKKDIFCIFPFNHINLKPQENGMVTLCWKSFENIGGFNKKALTEIWHGPQAQKVRENFLTGVETPGCSRCWDLENSGQGQVSLRQLYNKKYASEINSTKEKYLSKPQSILPKTAELRFSSTCNYRCLHCDSTYSSKWKQAHKQFPDLKDFMFDENKDKPNEILSKEVIDDFIKNLLSEMEEIRVSGGEPFIEPLFYYFLETIPPLIAEKINLIVTTNLSVLKHKGIDIYPLLSKFKKCTIRASIDGEPGMYSYFRSGGNIEDIIQNVKKIKDSDNSKVIVEGVCTVNIYNILRIKKVFEFFHSIDIKIHTTFVHLHPPYLDIRILPENIKKYCLSQVDDIIDTYKSSSHILEQCQLIKNFMLVENPDPSQWEKFLEFTKRMDTLNKTSFFKTYPEIKKFTSL